MSTLSVRKYLALAAIYEDIAYEYNEFFIFPSANFSFLLRCLVSGTHLLLFECNYYFPVIFSVVCFYNKPIITYVPA